MRAQVYGEGLSVKAVVGTHVALFGFDVPREQIAGLMGFALERTDVATGSSFCLDNFLLFAVNDVGSDSDHRSVKNPFQEFVWGDYTLTPGHEYRYVVSAMYGTPEALVAKAKVTIGFVTESEDDGRYGVYFNRGVAGSQAYDRHFARDAKKPGKPPRPADVGPAAYEWLSRGLADGMQAFIAQADGPRYALRAAVYEFEYEPALKWFKSATESGADVKIVFDSVDNHTKKKAAYPRDKNEAAIGDVGLTHCTPRTHTKIAHNKFVVLVVDGQPTAVWTGSTNFTEGGLYGQWNVGQSVRDGALAAHYLDYWNELSDDPQPAQTKTWTAQATPVPDEVPKGVTAIFSPRPDLGALDRYAKLMDQSTGAVFLTAAFGVSSELSAVFREHKPYLRYLLLDKRQGDVTTIARNASNRVTAGGYFGPSNSPFANWMQEQLTGFDRHVQYVHTKFMLLDPLSDDPTVITGSANFSEPSTTANDENMLVIRGDTRLADIYLGEFMRVFTHFRFRGKTKTPAHKPAPGPGVTSPAKKQLYLDATDAWARRFYVKNGSRTRERELFRAPPT
jgi:phosphatidylserine/phosphatidylglycerophosphate/cardiolipin synthase-like enzyme